MKRKDAKTRRRRHHSKSAVTGCAMRKDSSLQQDQAGGNGNKQLKINRKRKESRNCTQSHSQALSTRTGYYSNNRSVNVCYKGEPRYRQTRGEERDKRGQQTRLRKRVVHRQREHAKEPLTQ